MVSTYQPCTEIVALTTAESIDLSIAGATFLLALATFTMVIFVRSQAKETVRLANLAESQLESERMPILRIMREDDPRRADMVTVNKGQPSESLVVRIENHGRATAEPEDFSMTPGGKGKLADTGLPESPVIEPRGQWDVDFYPSEDDKAAHERGGEIVIQFFCLAIRSGLRYRMRTYLKRDDDERGERWSVFREVGPRRLGDAD